MTTRTNHIVRYYDSHELEGAELTQSLPHYAAIQYLIGILQWLFAGQPTGIASNVNFYHTDQPKEQPTSPDLVVVDGLMLDERTAEDRPSYYIGQDGPPPRMAIEVASKETWQNDVLDKPGKYARLGISEYFTFDPNPKGVWTGQWRGQRLLGWRLAEDSQEYRPLEKDVSGRLWSEQLQSFVLVKGGHLRLYTAGGELRVSEAEAQAQRVEEAWRRAENESRKVAKLAEALRRLGYNPDELI